MSSSPWDTAVLSDLAEDWKQSWKPAASTQEFVDHYSIPAYDNGMRPSRDRPSDIKSNKRVVVPDAVLVSRLNPMTPRIWAPTLNSFTESVCSGEMLVLRPMPGVDRGYLEYLCKSPHVSRAMLERVSGTTGSHQRVSPRDVLALTVPRPPLKDQRAIAEVLGSLDDRIGWAQAARLKVLDCARAVWASASTAESRDVTVGDIAMFHNRRRIPLSARERENRPGPYPYYGATGQFGSVDDYLFDGNFVLVGEDGSVVNPDGTPVVQYVSNRFWVNNHAHVLTSEELTPEELFLALQRVNVSGYVTGAAQPKLSMGRLKQVPTFLPLRESIEQARPTISALFESFRELAGEVEVLEATRDALLPKLVSGELRIEDPQRLLDQVA